LYDPVSSLEKNLTRFVLRQTKTGDLELKPRLSEEADRFDACEVLGSIAHNVVRYVYAEDR